MFAYDQAFSLRCLRKPIRYPSVLVIGEPPIRRHYWAKGLKQGLENLGQKASLRYLDNTLSAKQKASSVLTPLSSFKPAAWEGDSIDLIEVSQPIERVPSSLICSSLMVLVVSGNSTALKNVYACIKHCSIHYNKQRFYLLGDAATFRGESVSDHLKHVTQRFLPVVELINLSHMTQTKTPSVSFKSNATTSLYTKVFRQLAFMLYDSVLFESAPSEMPNCMSKEHYVSSR